MAESDLNIIGAGLCGALLATLLAKRGFRVDVYERRGDPRTAQAEAGRSINLALAARGLRALELAGVTQYLNSFILPMRGRMIHAVSGELDFQPYGSTPEECNYSVGRAALNRMLIDAAAKQSSIRLNFEHTFVGIDEAGAQLILQTRDGKRVTRPISRTIATDGAGSPVRLALARSNRVRSSEAWLDHDYKELTIPAAAATSGFDREALHIWPRGGYMLIALPNPDMTFTATAFLPREGLASFAALKTPEHVRNFFTREFPDAARAMPQLAAEFFDHPQGRMATVHCGPWFNRYSDQDSILLLGDAAHAIVPFHGQGMNAAFEDCVELCKRLDAGESLLQACENFEQGRHTDTQAIAAMALENYVEMRDTVRDPAFVRMKALGAELERRFPEQFIPRYSMVMFHPEISYAQALRRGAIQTEILTGLETGSLDAAQAASLIEARLARVCSS